VVLKELVTAYHEFANQTNIIPPDFVVLGLGVSDATAFEG